MNDGEAKGLLVGRTALVTGGARGIGAACVRALAAAGAHVYCADVAVDAARGTAEACSGLGGRVEACALDVTDTQALATAADALPVLDVLVCNAGIASNTAAEEMTDETWDRMININLTGVFKTCRAFGRKMLQAGRGSIINMGSMSGTVVNVPQPQCHYNAAKAGVHQLTRSLAVEWATRGVRVNAVAPTYIATDLLEGVKARDPEMVQGWIGMTPMKRVGKPDEVASVVLFLASDASSLMTGAIVPVDAGYTCV